MLEGIILGVIQGIAEWLPVSSEGMIALVKVNLYQETDIQEIVRFALFLHLGTFLAALVYLRKDVLSLLKALFRYQSAESEHKSVLRFLIVSTLISGALGAVLLKVLTGVGETVQLSSKTITFAIGLLLLITAGLQLKRRKGIQKNRGEVRLLDGVLLGVAQGLAVLPGLSRSGLTVSTLLLRRFGDTHALQLSFLMSLPIVLAGNVVLNIKYFSWSLETGAGLLFSFLFGISTIHILLKFAERVNFGYFVFAFGLLMMASIAV